jgi:hypothetical protein
MAAAFRAIAAAESRNRNWQLRKSPYQLTFITAGENPTSDYAAAFGQLVDMPAHGLSATEMA